MSEENEVPSDEEILKHITCEAVVFCTYKHPCGTCKGTLIRIKKLLSALRASWEREKYDLLTYGANQAETIGRLEAEKKGLEERVRQAESLKDFTLSTNKELSTQFYAETLKRDKEINRLKEEIKCWEIDSDLTKALRENEEITRLKAENAELTRKMQLPDWQEKSILLDEMHTIAEERDTMTLALAEAHRALAPFATLTEYDVMSAPVAVGWLTNAKKALANKDGQRASEEMKGLRKVVEAVKEFTKIMRSDLGYASGSVWSVVERLENAYHALEAYESRGKV